MFCDPVIQIFVYIHNVYEISKDYKYSKGKKEEENSCVIHANVTMMSTQYRYIYQN